MDSTSAVSPAVAAAIAECVRQLSEGLKHFVRCETCGSGFAGEMPIETCPECGGPVEPNPEDERAYLTEHVKKVAEAALQLMDHRKALHENMSDVKAFLDEINRALDQRSPEEQERRLAAGRAILERRHAGLPLRCACPDCDALAICGDFCSVHAVDPR